MRSGQSPPVDPTSPVTGTIVRWRIMDGSGGPYGLRVLTPGSAARPTRAQPGAKVNVKLGG